MEKQTLRRLGAQLRKEIVPLEGLPYPMREALRRLAEKPDGCPVASNDDERKSRKMGQDNCGEAQLCNSSLPKS
jgi:hypothetical protein